MAPAYKYNRLDLATYAIRLVRLLKGDQGEPVNCEIFETYLHQVDGIPYDALSYVWGTRQSVDKIRLDGYLFEVTENLHEALVHLRRIDEDRVLWIDAICIDQSHNAERGHQVGQMSRIYHNAQRVVIWLGASTGQIDCLFYWMTALNKQVLTTASPHTLHTWENQWSMLSGWQLRGQFRSGRIRDALYDLLEREWFSRVWVLQEAALAKSAVITCGRNEVNSRTFVAMPSLLNINCSEGQQSRLDILPGLFRADLGTASGGCDLDLLQLLLKFGRSKASDPRDIIYALIGLSGDSGSSELQPDYEITLPEVTQKSVAYFMKKAQDIPQHTPVQALPMWDIDEFLDSLPHLALRVFQWATDQAQDKLLYDLLSTQRRKQRFQLLLQCMSYAGQHGPPISIAIKARNLPLMDLLLQLPYVDLETRDKDGNTPRSLAAGQGNMVVADLVVRGSFLANQPSIVSEKTLRIASNHGIPFSDLREVYLYQEQADSPLFIAIDRGDSASVASILNGFAEYPGIVNSNGDGPLNLAARKGDENILDLLLNMASSERALRFRGSDGLTPLESALAGGSSGIQKLLLYHLGAVNNAVKANQFKFLSKILDVEPGLANDGWLHFRMPPGEATQVGHTSLVSLLPHGAADIHGMPVYKPGKRFVASHPRNHLAAAPQAGHMSLVSHLLDRAADIRTRARAVRALAPLWIAAPRDHLDTVRLLVDGAADPGLMANETPIQNTSRWVNKAFSLTAVVRYDLGDEAKVDLTVNGSSSNSLDNLSRSRNLPWAAACGVQPEDVRALAKGVDIEVSGPWWYSPRDDKSKAGSSHTWAKPIWVAASLGHTDTVSLLIQYGADIEARDTHYGMTPFLIASHQNKPEVMMVLIEGGADVQAKPLW